MLDLETNPPCIYPYHIHYPNLACFSSLKVNYKTLAYQIPSFALKPIKSYVTKPKRVL
jgi:hypothetical protein